MDNKKNMVVYKNELNTVVLKDFTSTEFDLLHAIILNMKDRRLDEVKFTFRELKQLSRYNKKNAIESFVKDLESTYDKLINLNVKIGTTKKWTKFVFFTKYGVDIENQIITIALNKEFSHLINDISKQFTQFELEELTSLKSIYSKCLYRQLKQYRKTGYVILKMEDFRRILSVPKTYKTGHIDQKILKPATKELSKFFKNLRYEKRKEDPDDKRKVTHIEFFFKNEDDLESGVGVFRDDNGKYYERHIKDFDEKEIKASYPESPESNLNFNITKKL